MEQLTARAELENDVVELRGFRKVDESDHVGMVQLAHNLDFFQYIGSLYKSRVSRDFELHGARIDIYIYI